jgi:hypothetical protein
MSESGGLDFQFKPNINNLDPRINPVPRIFANGKIFFAVHQIIFQ